eukprot:801102-Pleurochrysis_carterae.AAC.2
MIQPRSGEMVRPRRVEMIWPCRVGEKRNRHAAAHCVLCKIASGASRAFVHSPALKYTGFMDLYKR